MLTIAHLNHLHPHKFEAFHLESLDDLSDDAPLHAIGLDGNEGALFLSHDSETKQRFKEKKKDRSKKESLQLQGITHRSRWHLAQAAVGSAAEGPDPIAEKPDYARFGSVLSQQCRRRTCSTATQSWPHPQGFNQPFQCTPRLNATEVQASRGTCSWAK